MDSKAIFALLQAEKLACCTYGLEDLKETKPGQNITSEDGARLSLGRPSRKPVVWQETCFVQE